MLEVIGGAAVSAVVITGGLGLIANDFRKRWPQIVAAFEQPGLQAIYDFRPIPAARPSAMRRQLQPAYQSATVLRRAA